MIDFKEIKRVVFCKNCKAYIPDSGYCRVHQEIKTDFNYCSDGVRKEKDGRKK